MGHPNSYNLWYKSVTSIKTLKRKEKERFPEQTLTQKTDLKK